MNHHVTAEDTAWYNDAGPHESLRQVAYIGQLS